MELTHQTPPSVADQYHARFGDAGAFDRSLFPELATVALMAEALRRDSPVTQEDLEAAHQTLYRQPMPTPETTSAPSGVQAAPPGPEEAAYPAFFYAPPQLPLPPEEPAS